MLLLQEDLEQAFLKSVFLPHSTMGWGEQTVVFLSPNLRGQTKRTGGPRRKAHEGDDDDDNEMNKSTRRRKRKREKGKRCSDKPLDEYPSALY